MFYVIYRWVISLYFGGYFIAFLSTSVGSKFMIFLTNWSYIVLNLHFLYSALSTTIDFFKAYLCCRQHYNDLAFERDADEFEIVEPKGCFDRQNNSIKWYHMIQWVLFIAGTQAAVIVVILFWGLLYRGYDITLYDGHYHLGNGIAGVLDLWVSGFPIRFLHFYIIQIYAATYASFTGIYYGAGGTGYNGTSYIYPPLNYEESPGFAAGLVIGVVIVVPIVHLLFYAQYVARFWLIYALYGRPSRRSRANATKPVPQQDDEEMNNNSALGMTEYYNY